MGDQPILKQQDDSHVSRLPAGCQTLEPCQDGGNMFEWIVFTDWSTFEEARRERDWNLCEKRQPRGGDMPDTLYMI